MSRKQSILRDLKSLGQIEPDAGATDRALARAEAALHRLDTVHPGSAARKHWAARALGAAAAAAIVILLASHWLGVFGSGAGLAFAEVQEQVARTKSIQYVETTKVGVSDDSLAEIIAHVRILGDRYKRIDEIIKPGKNQAASFAKAPQGPLIVVFDLQQGIQLSLLPATRTYVVTRGIQGTVASAGQGFTVTLNKDKDADGKVTPMREAPKVTNFKVPPEMDFYELIRNVPSDKAKKLAEKQVGGRPAIGFLVEQKIPREAQPNPDVWQHTWWVDPETKLPIRLDVSFRSGHPQGEKSDIAVTDIVFDAPLDLALFSTEPPKGYTDLAAAKPQPDTKKDAESAPGSRLGASLLTPLLFAQVQKEVSKTKSVQYVRTVTVTSKEPRKLEETVRRVMVLAPALQREDVTVTYGDNPTHYIDIYDARKGETISLHPEKKQFSIDKTIYYLDLETGKGGTEVIKPDPTVDFYQAIRKIPADNVKQLPERTIDGKKAVGFLVEDQIKRADGTDTVKKTYWVDVATKLPVLIESSYRSTRPHWANSYSVTREIVFDAPLDEKLFSFDPPEGWTDMAAKNAPEKKRIVPPGKAGD